MSFRKKKSLSVVLFGLVLFLFTISIQNLKFGGSNGNDVDTGSGQSLGTSENFSLVQKPLQLSEGSKFQDDSHAVKSREEQKKTDKFQVMSQEKPVKNLFSHRRHHGQEKTTASRDFVSRKITGKMRKRFPTAIILGVKKAGTRALLDILRMHPKVIGATNEVYFFNGYHDKGLEWYRRQMPESSPGQMTIEKSPTYFTSVKNTQIVNRMFIFSRSMAEGLKLIVVVRDPVERCVSEYTDMVARSKKEKLTVVDDFEKLVLREDGTVNVDSELVKTGLYYEHLSKWLEYFLENEIHFVSGEELVHNPFKEVKSVETFLELKPFFTDRNFRFNKGRRFPCFLPDPLASNKSFCLPPNKGRKHADIKQSTLELLKRFYQPHNDQLYSTVKRNFNWP